MYGQRFEKGQEVTRLRSGSWKTVNNLWNGEERDPQFGEVIRVRKYEWHRNQWFISFLEYPADQSYPEIAFVPLVSDSVLEKELLTIRL